MDELLREFLTETSESLDVADVELVKFELEPNNLQILNNRIVNFPGERTLIDSFVDVRIGAVVGHSLRGELLNGK